MENDSHTMDSFQANCRRKYQYYYVKVNETRNSSRSNRTCLYWLFARVSSFKLVGGVALK